MRGVLESQFDVSTLFEIRQAFASEIITGFASVKGCNFTFIANDPAVIGGLISPRGATKILRHVSLANGLGLPIVFFVDTGGLLIGKQAEREGGVRAVGELFASLARCQSPVLQVVVRRGYSAGLLAMGGPGFGDKFAALPSAELGVMGKRFAEKTGLETARLAAKNVFSLSETTEYEVVKISDLRSFLSDFTAASDLP